MKGRLRDILPHHFHANFTGSLMDNGKSAADFEPIKIGNLVARLAVDETEIEAAQALRFRVFYEEMSAHPSVEVETAKRVGGLLSVN